MQTPIKIRFILYQNRFTFQRIMNNYLYFSQKIEHNVTYQYNGDWMQSTWMFCHNNTNVTSVQEFYKCYDSMIFKKEEIILGSYYWDYINWKSPDLQIEWDELSYSMMYGRCQLARDIGEIEETKFIKLKLNDSLEYRVWIHDPNFFFMSWNPRSTPSLLAKLKFNKIDRNHIIQYISKEKNSLLNTEKAKIVHHSYFFLS